MNGARAPQLRPNESDSVGNKNYCAKHENEPVDTHVE